MLVWCEELGVRINNGFFVKETNYLGEFLGFRYMLQFPVHSSCLFESVFGKKTLVGNK